MVKALVELCAREGGHEFVAEKAKVSADNLWQILKGIKLPSGNPRGVGARLRERLTKAYPDWLTLKVEEPKAAYPVKLMNYTQPATNEANSDDETLSLMARALGKIFDGLPDDQVMRVTVFGQAANLILEAGRNARKTQPDQEHAPAQSEEKPLELHRIRPT